MTAGDTTFVVLDARDKLTASDRAARTRWLEMEGIDREQTYRVVVRPGNPPAADVFAFALDENGQRYCDRSHEHRHGGCVAAKAEPVTVTVWMPPPVPMCPGSCNTQVRSARSDYETALDLWEQAVAGWQRAHDFWVDQVAEAGPGNTFREPVRPPRPPTPDLTPTRGKPVWCQKCASHVRRALSDLDDLAALLEQWADGHRGATSGEKVTTKRTEAPSPSPITDTLLVLYDDLTEVEDHWRSARGYTHRPNRGRNGHARLSSVSWLMGQLSDILADSGSEKFGRSVLSWQRRLQELTRSEPVRRPRPGRCTRCQDRALWTRDDGYTECGSCGRLYSEEDYQEDVVDAQAPKAPELKAEAS